MQDVPHLNIHTYMILRCRFNDWRRHLCPSWNRGSWAHRARPDALLPDSRRRRGAFSIVLCWALLPFPFSRERLSLLLHLHWREVHLQMYIGIGFLLFPPLCLTWWWCMNTSIHHKEKRRFLSHLSVLLFFLTNYVQCCLADWVGLDPWVYHWRIISGTWHVAKLGNSIYYIKLSLQRSDLFITRSPISFFRLYFSVAKISCRSF